MPQATRWMCRNKTLAFDDPEAMCRAALLGLGVTLIASRAAASGNWHARAANPATVFRRRTDLDLLRDAHVVASQNARLRRFRS